MHSLQLKKSHDFLKKKKNELNIVDKAWKAKILHRYLFYNIVMLTLLQIL